MFIFMFYKSFFQGKVFNFIKCGRLSKFHLEINLAALSSIILLMILFYLKNIRIFYVEQIFCKISIIFSVN